MVARNIVKNLAVAEDLLHGVGVVEQARNGQVIQVHRIDIPIGINSEAELFTLDPALYPRARFGNTEFDYIAGSWRARTVIAPFLFAAGLVLDERYNQVIKDGVIARYTGTLPYTVTGLEDITTGSWQVIGGGSASGGGIEYVTAMPTTISEGSTLFQQNSYDLGFSINDGSSVQILEFSLAGWAAYSAGVGSGGATSIANASGTGNTMLNTISANNYSIKRLKAGTNVSISDDGNALTINATGGGGGTTTTLSNAGLVGFPLVGDVVGSDYPIKRLLAGANVSIVDNGTYYTIDAVGGSGTPVTIANTAVAGVTLLNTVSANNYAVKRIVAGVGVTIADSGDSVTINGSGVTDGDKGDIVVSAGGTAWAFDTNVVSPFARTLLDDPTASAMRTTLGAQPLSNTLTAMSPVASSANLLMYANGVNSFTMTPFTALARLLLEKTVVNEVLNALGIIKISNGNGVCLKFPTDGTTSGIQVCYKTGLATGSIANATGSMFVGDPQQWDFPVAFSSAPAITGMVTSNAAAWLGGGMSPPSTLSAFFRGYSAVSGTSATVCMIAIGTY